MNAKAFTKSLQKGIRQFERIARKYGEIIDETQLTVAGCDVCLWCGVMDNNGDYGEIKGTLEIESGELYCTMGGYPVE